MMSDTFNISTLCRLYEQELATLHSVMEIERTNWFELARPRVGETWEKLPCGKSSCFNGWSLGVGVHKITDRKLSWGTPNQLLCGCLRKKLQPNENSDPDFTLYDRMTGYMDSDLKEINNPNKKREPLDGAF